MAKRASRQESSDSAQEPGASTGGATVAEQKIEEFAEDLGRLLGTARAKAEGWIGQRQTVAKHLEDIRDTAAELLKKLGGSWGTAGPVGDTDGARRPGRPRKTEAAPDTAVAVIPEPKKKRTMSAAARQAISDAQKARWAKQKKAAKKAEKVQ